jgi:hypothetical protein
MLVLMMLRSSLNYTPSRDVTDNFVLTKLDAKSILRPYFHNATTGGNSNIEILVVYII